MELTGVDLYAFFEKVKIFALLLDKKIYFWGIYLCKSYKA